MKYISKIPNGRFRINCEYPNGKPYRPTFETVEEARRERDEFNATKAKGEIFSASRSVSATFGDALEIERTRPRERRLLKGSRDGLESALRQLQEEFGAMTLKALVEAELRPMQDFFNRRATERGATNRGKYLKSLIAKAFKHALAKKEWGITFNPLDRFELVVPFVQKGERTILSIEQISAMARAALERTKQDRLEITWSNRQLMFFFGLLTPMRNEEICGLCWDCLDEVHRTFLIHRIVREGDDGRYELVDDTKTGPTGCRLAPMAPFLVPLIEAHRERLIARGLPVKGKVPLLVPGQRLGNGLITPAEITRGDFKVLLGKAGVTLPQGLGFYVMRRTATNLLKSVGMDRDDLLELGGWIESDTYEAHYRQSSQEYKSVLRPEVEAMAHKYGFDLKSPAGLVDALGYVLVARWHHEGIGVPMAQPRQRQRSPLEAALLGVEEAPLLALPAPAKEDTTPKFPSVEAVRLWQIGESVRLRKEGWTNQRISKHLKVCASTVGMWLREADIPHTRGMSGISHATRAEKDRELLELKAKHPDWGVTELATATGLRPTTVARRLRVKGADPAPRKMPDYKLGKHDARIRKWAAEGKTFRDMEKLFHDLGEDISFSAIAYYAKKHGIKTKKWGSGERVDQYDAEIIRMVGKGMDGKAISEELPVSHSAVTRRIKKLGLKVKRHGTGHPIGQQYDADIRRLRAEGKNGKAISKVLGIAHSAVCRRINQLGLTTGRV